MKKLTYIAFAVLMTLPFMMVGCMNDNFDEPSSDSLNYKNYSGTPVNTTIKQLLTDYSAAIKANSMALVKTGTVIEGTVISSDENGNFYQSLVIQDATGGIQINISEKGLHLYYPLGQKVVINCDSLWIGGYGKSPILGGDYYNTNKSTHQVGRLNQTAWEAHATPDGPASASNLPAAKEASTYKDLTTNDICTLVTLKNVSFDDAQYKAFAPEAEQDGGYAVDRNVSFENGTYLVVRTSSYANFAKKALPGGTGDITGVLGYYNGTYQFVIRDYTKDLSSSFVQYDAVRTPLFSEPFTASLGNMAAKHVTSTSVPGTIDWSYSSKYKCAVMSGYDSSSKKNVACESYLISPSIDLSSVANAFISFQSAIAYANASTADTDHELLISTDYSGDPSTTTWTVLPFHMSFSTSGSFNFVSSGKVGIPHAFIGKKVTIALRYTSSSTKASTWEVNNLMLDEGKGEITLFSSSLQGTDGGFTAYSVTGSQVWTLNSSYGFKMSGYYKQNLANEDWAVSPEIDLAGADAPAVSFEHAINYAKGNPFVDLETLWITDNFTGDVTTTKWVQMTIPTYPTGADWTYVGTGNIAVPSALVGKKVRIAFKYLSNTTVATTWEIRNLVIK